MKVDPISTYCKSDVLIVIYGNKLCNKHYNNDDQSKYIANKLRELARLTLHMRKICPDVKTLDDIINPKLFTKVVVAVTDLCGWDAEKRSIATPSLGIKLGQLLTKVSAIVASRAIQSKNSNHEDRKRAKDFQYLIEREWDDEIAKQSRTELETRKWNKPQLIPLTEDLVKLKKHLLAVQKQSISDLEKSNTDLRAYKELTSSTLASIIIFNRRRQGEPSKLKIDYDDIRKHTFNKEVEESLTEFERRLCTSLKRIEIRGKRGRKVPLILTTNDEAAIKQLIKCRVAVGVNENNPYVFAVSSSNSINYIRGSDALRKHAQSCGLKEPDVVTSTKLRKHVATLTQLLNLEERELEMLATYLGHDISVHREFYRLPEHTTQLAKCGKLLTMIDEGKCQDFIGKRLDDINLDLGGLLFTLFLCINQTQNN